VLLFPVAKLTAALLNRWLGHEGITLLREQDFRALLARHGETEGAEVSQLEAIGARNFLDLDDIPVLKEGELIDPLSIVTLPTINQRPALPKFKCEPD
jgi:metal transporter CNNM